ncbi:MAG: lysylphosphatidylglycerol synthase domain-containing protein [Hyphomicrobiaceae bacterium]
MTGTPPARAYGPSISLVIKMLVATLLFYVIARYIDVGEALRRIGRADLWQFLLATGLIVFQHVFAALRWQVAVRAIGHDLPFATALSAYLEANFFNQALPSTVGGDAMRSWRAASQGMGIGPAVIGVLVDRALGLLALAILGIFGAHRLYQSPGGQHAGLMLGAIIALVIVGAIVGSLLSTLLPRLQAWGPTRPLYWLSDGVARVFRSPRDVALTLSHSIVGHLITVLAFERLAASLGLEIDLPMSLAALPAILLASAVPISISGWGVRESVGVVVLTLLGVAATDALALSLLLGLSLLAIGLLGGVIWLLNDINGVVPLAIAGQEARQDDSRASDSGMTVTATVEAGSAPTTGVLSTRKRAILEHAEANAATRDDWIARNTGYFGDDRRFMRYLIPEGSRVLALGCGTGDLLAKLNPSRGVGIDLSPQMIAIAQRNYPNLEFLVGDAENPDLIAGIEGPFDYIVLADTIGLLDDIETALGQMHRLCSSETRIVIGYYSHLWEPLVYLGDRLKLRPREPSANFISSTDFENILTLADFEPIRTDWRQLIPYQLFGIGTFINRFIGTLPVIRRLCLRRYIVARSLKAVKSEELTVSVLIPCRNERGNIENAVKRMPRFGKHQEIVFIEGNSKDDTYEECLRVQAAYKGEWDIKVAKQEGRGKGDAMRKGYATATGDVLMILDADLTVPPETMPRFYQAIASGKADFVNGSRLIYPMENEAMRPLNLVANRAFALIFTFLLNQRFTDTLCGTKVFRKRAYDRIAAGRSYFGDFDPFGDFDLIFGATKQNLKIVEVAVQYQARVYGETQISRFRDGFLLLKMVLFAWRKLKAI